MKLLLGFLLVNFFNSLRAQPTTIDSINELKRRIDNTVFTDTVYITDATYDLRQWNSIGVWSIFGYLKNDTLLKTISRLKNSRTRVTYYGSKHHDSDGDVIYVKDYDESTGKLLAEAWGTKTHNNLFDSALMANIPNPHLDDEKNGELLLARGNYAFDVRSKQVDRKAKKYDFVVELIENIRAIYTSDCCYGAALKFRILKSSDSFYLNKRVYLAIPNLTIDGAKIFTKGKRFKMHVATNNGAPNTLYFGIDFLGVRDIRTDRTEDLPILWVRQFTPIE